MAVAMDKSIEQLNSYLRAEIASVETYRQALDSIKEPNLKNELEEASQSHQERVAKLRERIVRMGGTPATGSGVWGAFAKLMQGGANLAGDTAAITVLEEGEDHTQKTLREGLSNLDAESRKFVEEELLPAQKRTHSILSTLKHSRKEASSSTSARR